MTTADDTLWVGDLWRRVQPHALAQATELEHHLRICARSGGDAASREAATEIAHRLAGSLGSYGLTEASQLARTLHGRLYEVSYTGGGNRHSAARLAGRLRRAIAHTELPPSLTWATRAAGCPRRERYMPRRSPRPWR